MKKLEADTLVARQLTRLTNAIVRRPGIFIYPQLLLCVLCILYTAFFLKFDANRDNLVGANKKHRQNFKTFKKEFPLREDIVVVVESEDPEKNRQFVERLGARLESDTNFTDVFYKGDMKMLGSKALLFVPEDDLKALKKKLGEFKPFVQQFARTTNLVTLFDMVNKQFRTSGREKNEKTDSLINALPALERIVNQAESSLRRPGVPPSPGVTALFDAGGKAEQEAYITFKKGSIYLVNAHAATKDDETAVLRLRKLVDIVKREVPGVNVGPTGGPVLDYDEMLQSKKDMALASIVSLTLSALIFIYGYQQTGRPIKATICLIVGLAYTMAFATFAIGSLNILTITFMPMLIGLAIDFGVHLVTRYEEELRNGKTEREALTKAMVFTGRGIFTGAMTTAGAFLAMGFTDFKGIQQMGIIAGAGLMICLVPMMTMLPALLLRGRQNVIDHEKAGKDTRARIEGLWLERPIIVACITAALCGLAATQLHKIHFDYNLLNMQSGGLLSVEFEKKLISSASRSALFGAVVANDLDEAVEMEAKLKKLPSVSGVDSMARFLKEDQTAKLGLIGEIKGELADVHFAEPDPNPVRISELSRSLYSFYGYLGAAHDEVQKHPEEKELAERLASVRDAVERLRKQMFNGPPKQIEANAAKLGAFQRALFNDLRDTFETLRTQDNTSRLRAEDLPAPLRHRFIGVTGKYLLQVYPNGDLWQREVQKEFLDEVSTVYPDVTGTPVQLYQYTNLLKESYQQAAWYALIAIAIMVLFHFRSISSVILALLPVAIGTLWMLGLMGFFNIPFNPANIMTLPLVIGIGVTNGIHILNRFAEERTPSILAKSTGKAVLVSALTTIAGFGSLILAKHQGIQSLGDVMATGVAACMIAGLTFLPAFLNLLMRTGFLGKQRPSIDNAQSTLGREEPR